MVKGIVAVEPPANFSDPAIAGVEYIRVAAGSRAQSREALAPVLAWLDSTVNKGAPAVVVNDAHPNRESTALKLADQGGFWVGVQRKQMPYGTIAQGQMFVQYMIPAERRHPYPVVMTHGGGGQGTHMMGIGGRPGWVHYFVQAGYAVYWIDRPSYGRSPYHPDALGPSHLPNVPPFEGLITSTAVFNTAQWPGPGGMNDPHHRSVHGLRIRQRERRSLPQRSGLARRRGTCWIASGRRILVDHAFGGFFGWGVADRRPNLVKAIYVDGDQRQPLRGAVALGLDGESDDLRSSRDRPRAVPPGGPH